jgi:hypothetical protein
MKKEQVDVKNAVVWIPDSKTSNGVAEVPLTEQAVKAFEDQITLAKDGRVSLSKRAQQARLSTNVQDGMDGNPATGQRASTSDLRPALNVRDAFECRRRRRRVGTQLLRQGDAKAFKEYSQMQLQMKGEALQKMNRLANLVRASSVA